MNITEVRVKLMHHRSDRLRAFCSITIDDDFVVHDLRVIEGRKGFFVAMPSRKLSDNCPKCGYKNDLRAGWCGGCGAQLDPDRAGDELSHDKLHVDVAHPINTPCRELIQKTVLDAYHAEVASREGGADAADDERYDYDNYHYEDDDEFPEEDAVSDDPFAQEDALGPAPEEMVDPESDLSEGERTPQPTAEGPGVEAEREPSGKSEGRKKPRRARGERRSGGFGDGIL